VYDLTAILFFSGPLDLTFWAASGAVAGVYLFYRGFRVLQRKRLLLNTPVSKIRSAAMGLVEVNGLAVGPYTMNAPITGKPCYYYQTLVWQLRQSGKNSEWDKVVDESLHVPFYLNDTSGHLLVEPQGAEMDLHRDFHEEYGGSLFGSEEIPPSVRSFLNRHSISTEKKLRIDEYCIKPKNALFILGTLAENPGVKVEPRALPALPGKAAGGSAFSERAFAISGKLVVQNSTVKFAPDEVPPATRPQEVVRLSASGQPANSATMTQQGKIAAALMKAGINSPAAWAVAGVPYPEAGGTAVAVSETPSGSGSSTAEAATEFDLHPPVVLMKGEHTPTFLISWRSQGALVKSMGWQSVTMIWGGPALTLICAYLLLLRLGWL
jgi:hypothetical protein